MANYNNPADSEDGDAEPVAAKPVKRPRKRTAGSGDSSRGVRKAARKARKAVQAQAADGEVVQADTADESDESDREVRGHEATTWGIIPSHIFICHYHGSCRHSHRCSGVPWSP